MGTSLMIHPNVAVINGQDLEQSPDFILVSECQGHQTYSYIHRFNVWEAIWKEAQWSHQMSIYNTVTKSVSSIWVTTKDNEDSHEGEVWQSADRFGNGFMLIIGEHGIVMLRDKIRKKVFTPA